MRRKTLTLFALVLAITSIAFATTAQASSQSKGKAAPKVTYILKGTLSDFTAASTTANGSVTIHVTHSNYHARALVGQDLTFAVSMNTTTTTMGGTIINGARGVVKFRAPLRESNATLMASLTTPSTPMTASQIVAH